MMAVWQCKFGKTMAVPRPPWKPCSFYWQLMVFTGSGHRPSRIRQHLGSRIPRRLLHFESVSRQKGKKCGITLLLGFGVTRFLYSEARNVFFAPLVFSWGLGLLYSFIRKREVLFFVPPASGCGIFKAQRLGDLGLAHSQSPRIPV